MGAYLDKPITETENEDGGDKRTQFGMCVCNIKLAFPNLFIISYMK